MGATTEIAWTDRTFNPWWGCARVSPGCTHCYAEAWATRTGRCLWGPHVDRRTFGAAHWREPVRWNAAAQKSGIRSRVFCASMADVFEYRRDLDQERCRLWELIDATPYLTWQVLTKRPEHIARLSPGRWAVSWPRNIWLGATCEDQRRAEERLPALLAVPAAVHFVSAEPLLAPLDLRPWLSEGIDWVIVGGESGHRARICEAGWMARIVADCRTAGVSCFVKQGGSNAVPALRHPKGGDPSEWPAELRVREFPRQETP